MSMFIMSDCLTLILKADADRSGGYGDADVGDIF